METGYILTKTTQRLNEILKNLSDLIPLSLDGSAYLEINFETIREKNPTILVLSDELDREDIFQLTESIKSDRSIDSIGIVLWVNRFDNLDWYHLLEKNLIEGWIAENEPKIVQLFFLRHILDYVKIQRDLAKVQINNDFLQSEISFYERKRIYREGLEQKERSRDLVNFMHFVRTYLTGIKGGFDLVLKERIGTEEKKVAMDLVLRNIHNIEDYINQQDFTIKEEKRAKTIQPIIIKLRPLLINLEKQIVYEARKRNITVYNDFPQNDHSILAKNADTEILIDSLLTCSLKAIKENSIVKFGARLLNSAHMVEIYLKTNKDTIDAEILKDELSKQVEAMQILNDKESKLELFEETNHFGLRFYLPRLS